MVSNGEAKGGAAAAGGVGTPACDDGDEHTEVATGETVASLPQETRSRPFPSLRLYRGFWIPESVLLTTVLPPEARAPRSRPTDLTVLLTSFPKSGTTWLKSLAFAAARRSVHPPSDAAHPLLHANPHDLVSFISTPGTLSEGGDHDTAQQGPHSPPPPPPPRLLATHLPYSLLPERATAEDGGCRIVHVCREPKDTLVSSWHFTAGGATAAAAATDEDDGLAGGGGGFEEAFELHLRGRCAMGPQWEHVLEYWEASRRRPASVLFLRYEAMVRDPEGSLRRVAEFMGCPFTAAEEDAGVPGAVVELCSLEKQRGLEVNRHGRQQQAATGGGVLQVDNKCFFRKGVVGDWRNHMTVEMAARMDAVVEEALRGSGFTFGDTE